MDAVFYPNIYSRKEIFQQEGWHYELQDAESELIYNGVVYNEMKGAFSSPESVLSRKIQNTLYPDTCYSVESGGDPDNVPDLTYEDYLAFHKKYYHPSNSYIIFYGDMDVVEKLTWLDEEYLSHFTEAKVDSEIKPQPKFDEVRKSTCAYPVGLNDEIENKTFLSCSYAIGTSLDQELCTAFALLEQVLLSNPGAPLKQALLDANIGDDVTSGFNSEIRQPTLSIKVKNSEASKLEEFIRVLRETLEKIVKEGLEEKSLRATLSKMSFEYREADFRQFPKGLMYSLQMLSTWIYDEDAVFSTFHEDEIIETLKRKIGTRYFEELIQTYLLDNTHCAILALVPERGLNQKKEEALREKLAAYKASLNEKEIQDIIDATKHLKLYQDTKMPFVNQVFNFLQD